MPAAAQDVANDFDAAMAALGPFEAKPMLALAVSGGPDSLALTMLAHDWARSRGGTVVALTVDHRLRPESSREARTVGSWLGARGVRHHILVWHGAKRRTGLQQAARAARYALLSAWCRDHGVVHLLLAHQQEDQAETLLMRLAQGSGFEGLAGMARLAERQGVRLLRPLLGVPRARLVALLEAEGQSFVDDPSNRNPAFLRVRLRRELEALRASGIEADAIATLAARLGKARAAIEAERARLMARSVTLSAAGYAQIALNALDGVPDRPVAMLLGAVLTTVGGALHPPAPEALARLVRAVRGGRLAGGRTLGGCRVVLRQGRLLIVREAAACAAPLTLNRGEVACWDNRYRLVGHAAAPRAGALSMAGVAALRRQGEGAALDHVPAPARPVLPAIHGLDGVFSLPQISFEDQGDGKQPSHVRWQAAFRPRRSLAEAAFVPLL